MSGPSLSLLPSLAHVFGHPKPFRAYGELDALLIRMRERLYPETLPVLASYWLKTVYPRGHNQPWWAELNQQLKHVLSEYNLDDPSREALVDIQAWVQQNIIATGKAPEKRDRPEPPFRADLPPDRLASYIYRLLNEWLPAEVANLLTNDREPTPWDDGGVPVLAVAKALERILVRERLSPASLEMLLAPELLSPELLSPKDIYPADVEMLRDIVLELLGRTSAPPPSVMPAALVGIAAGSALQHDYQEAVSRAVFVQRDGRDEIHVPIAAERAAEILRHDPLRIGSILVSMDGRSWHSESLESGEQHFITYTPGERLRIDLTTDHAKLRVPWPETQLSWPGAIPLGKHFQMFGREWRAVTWETDGERTFLDLSFRRLLPIPEYAAPRDEGVRRLRTAAADMAWSELELALANALSKRSSEPVEQLRRTDLIPFGRAVYEFAAPVYYGRMPNRESFQTRLRSLVYLQAEISLRYGRVPWRIVPSPVRATILKTRLDPGSLELLDKIFDELPDAFTAPIRKGPPQAA